MANLNLTALGCVLGIAGAMLATPASAEPLTVTGVFTSTSPACGSDSVTCSGVGTSTVLWGAPVLNTVAQSQLSFVAASNLDTDNIAAGTPVSLGLLSFGNGTAQLDTWIDGLNLQISVTGGFGDPVLDIPITAVNTLCFGGESQEQCADFLYFSNAAGFGSFRVWEGFYGNVELFGLFGSLNLGGFGAITGVGFYDQLTGEFGPAINPQDLPSELQVGFISPSVTIDEPTTVLLILGALAAIGTQRRRQQRILV